MAAGKAEIIAVLGSTFPTLYKYVTFLSHFLSQKNNSGHGITGAGRGSERVCGGRFGHGRGEGRRGRGGGGGGGRTTVAACNYTYSKWENISNDHKDMVRELRVRRKE